nr:MAG TPA: Telomere repeats-binding bouquet formation protein [Caudoviricetes sp.]
MLSISLKLQMQVLNRYWVKNGGTLTPAAGISNVNAQHFFKITD